MKHSIDSALTEHRRHIAHMQRELYEHNIDDPCPCGVCARDRYEARASLFIIAGLFAIGALAMLAVWL